MRGTSVDVRHVRELQIVDVIVRVLAARVCVAVARAAPSMTVRHHETAVLGAGAILAGFLFGVAARSPVGYVGLVVSAATA